jgi:hypothetical protein
MKNMDNTNKKKLQQAINFIEELSWLVNSKNVPDLKEIPELIRSAISDSTPVIAKKYSSKNQNKNSLVGVLPNLFLDLELFKTNGDIAEFSESVLKIEIPRFEKRSRFEIIGLIVCEIPRLEDKELAILVNAIEALTGDNDKLKKVKAEKQKANFSWNQTIQLLNNL